MLAALTASTTLALALSSALSQPAGATTSSCAPTLPGATGIAAGSALTNESQTAVTSELNGIQALRSQWIRVDVDWSYIQRLGPTSYDWSHDDPPIQGAVARGINIDGVLMYTPAWAQPAGANNYMYPPTNPSVFASFAAAAVRHYAPMGVHTWEVWNEPNNPGSWRPAANVAQYAAMLKDAYVAIKSVDPAATVLTGGMSPDSTTATSMSPIDFLNGLYANGAGGHFDEVGHHPYTFPAMPGTTDSWSAWAQMADTNPSLRSVMVAHGDGNKKIWATEFGAPTNEVTEAQQASAVTQAYQTFESYPWAGPLFVYSHQDLGTDTTNRYDWFGLLRYDGSQKPSWSTFQSAATAFNNSCSSPPPPPPPPPCTTYSSAKTGSHKVCGKIRDKYQALGGPSGFLGYPVTDETATPDGVGRYNHFANNGSIYWTPSTGAWSIHGAIRAKWAKLGWERSFLGYPVSDETGTPDGVGRFNHFNRSGSIYWTSSTGAWSIHGAIRAKYLAMGGPVSVLGYPVTDETGTPDGVGRFNHFNRSGSIYWKSSLGAWSIHGAIRAKWASMGWERSCLAYPRSDEFAMPGGRESDLQRGVISYSWTTGQADASC